MKKLILAALLATATTFTPVYAEEVEEVGIPTHITVVEGWVRATASPTVLTTAAYMTLKNGSDGDDILVGADFPGAAMTELHTTVEENGVMRMEEVDGIDVPAGEIVQLSPSGNHIMLMGLESALNEGDSVDLLLTFEQAGEIAVTLPVKKGQ